MFTGIVEEKGILEKKRDTAGGAYLSITARSVLTDTKLGDSIMVDGACLTVTAISRDSFEAFVSRITMLSSTLGTRKIKSELHLERAMTPRERFGGHIMSGHVDGMGVVKKITKDGESHILQIEFPEISSGGMEFAPGIVEKGSIGIDGVSLTIVGFKDNVFWVNLIPETSLRTHLLQKKQGDQVNLEIDMLAKYVQRAMETYFNKNKGELTMDKIREMGY